MSFTITQGLTAQQRVFQTVAGNIANVNSEGYTEKTTPLATDSFGTRGSGVKAGAEQRLEDNIRTEDVREKTIGVSYLESIQTFYDEIGRQMGKPGDKGTLGYNLTDIKTALSTLETSPEDSGAQSNALAKLNAFAGAVNKTANFFQDQRLTAEDGLVDAVKRVNDILQSLHKLNGDISLAHGRGEAYGNMMDKQDGLLKELSQYVDAKLLRRENKSIDITTLQGNALLLRSGPRALQFSRATSIGPTDNTTNLGRITIEGDPVTDISSGRIGAFLKARDELFPKLQQELDQFTLQVNEHFNKIHNRGTGFPPPNTLTGATQFVDPAAETIEMTGTVRLAIVDQATGRHAFAPITLDYTAGPININAVAADINAQLNPGGGLPSRGTATVTADNRLEITAANATHGIALASETDPEAVDTTSGRGFSHHFGFNNLFSVNGEVIGAAQAFEVNPEISGNAARIARGHLSLQDPADNPYAIRVGSKENITDMLAHFDDRLGFAAAGSLTQQNTSATDYVNSIYHTVAVDGKNNQTQLDIDSTILADTEKTLADRTGVNMQRQFELMLESQKIFSALSRLLQAEDQMIKQLTNI